MPSSAGFRRQSRRVGEPRRLSGRVTTMYEISKDFRGFRKKWLGLFRRHIRLIRTFLKGLPAVAAFAGVLYLAFAIATQRKDQLVGRYLDRASLGLRTGDFRVARVGYE